MQKYKYLFGPVPSRRFGRSLGIDLTPFKTCSFDCVFCQLGHTTDKTLDRREYVPLEEVLSEIREWLKTDGDANYITLSGSGEPTLHLRFGEVLDFLRTNTTIPSVLLTNGTMLHLPEVREAALIADVVKVSLSAWDQASYRWINRPHDQLQFDRMFEGLKAFRDRFKGELWVEVFLVEGLNAIPADVRKIAALMPEIRPDRIHLNTAVRPPSEDFAAAVPMERIKALSYLFHPLAEVIPEFNAKHKVDVGLNREAIISMLQRRPCTSDQISEVFGMHRNEVAKYLGNMLRTNKIRAERRNNAVYYTATNGEGENHAHP